MPGERLGSLLVGPGSSGAGTAGRAKPAPGRSQTGLRSGAGLRPQVAAAQVWRDRRMCGWRLLVLWALLPATAAGSSGRWYPHSTVLDPEGKYWLRWGRQGGRLAFRLEVRTTGYVGFGFSPTGTMAAADIVVGGVARGRPYLQVSLGLFQDLPEHRSSWLTPGARCRSGWAAESTQARGRLILAWRGESLSPSLPPFAQGPLAPALGSLPKPLAVPSREVFLPGGRSGVLVPHLTDRCAPATRSPHSSGKRGPQLWRPNWTGWEKGRGALGDLAV